jgi:high-affinity nickel-transport protein
MSAELGAASGLAMMFLLGLRHGFDPDHIACIDGFTWRSLDWDQRFAPWVGTLFALGHGFIVTATAVCVGELSQNAPVSDELMMVFAWIPTFLLFVVGFLNLRELLRANSGYRPIGWRMRFLPEKLRNQSNPLAIILVGMLFAAVFDTATQASMWAYVGTTNGGTTAALIAGLAFTIGMMLTDTIDGRLLCQMVKRSDGAILGRRYQRVLGWLIVSLSFGAGFYNVAIALLPTVELDDMTLSAIGFSLLFVVFMMWVWSYRGKLLRTAQ